MNEQVVATSEQQVVEYKYCTIILGQNTVQKRYREDHCTKRQFDREMAVHRVLSDADLSVKLVSFDRDTLTITMERLEKITVLSRRVIIECLNLIDQLHQLGYFHGDIRLQNFMQTKDGRIKFIDLEYTHMLTDFIQHHYSKIKSAQDAIDYDYGRFWTQLRGRPGYEWVEEYMLNAGDLNSNRFELLRTKPDMDAQEYFFARNVNGLGMLSKRGEKIEFEYAEFEALFTFDDTSTVDEFERVIVWCLENTDKDVDMICSCLVQCGLFDVLERITGLGFIPDNFYWIPVLDSCEKNISALEHIAGCVGPLELDPDDYKDQPKVVKWLETNGYAIHE